MTSLIILEGETTVKLTTAARYVGAKRNESTSSCELIQPITQHAIMHTQRLNRRSVVANEITKETWTVAFPKLASLRRRPARNVKGAKLAF